MTDVFFRPDARKGLTNAPRKDQERINAAIEVLQRGLFPPHTKKLVGMADGYRTRVGRWRIVFLLKQNITDIADIFLKKERGDYRRKR